MLAVAPEGRDWFPHLSGKWLIPPPISIMCRINRGHRLRNLCQNKCQDNVWHHFVRMFLSDNMRKNKNILWYFVSFCVILECFLWIDSKLFIVTVCCRCLLDQFLRLWEAVMAARLSPAALAWWGSLKGRARKCRSAILSQVKASDYLRLFRNCRHVLQSFPCRPFSWWSNLICLRSWCIKGS